MLKKTLLLLPIVLSLTSCNYSIHIQSIENFSFAHSSIGITKDFLPFYPDEETDEMQYKKFLSLFPYLDGDYHYYYFDVIGSFDPNCYEIAVLYLRYDDETYLEAKNHCLEVMDLSKVNTFSYNDYQFMENLALAKRYEHYENGINTEFPYHFTMFSYKDTINTLVFLGFYISYDGEEAVLELSKDWGLFLDTYFSPYYDFSK